MLVLIIPCLFLFLLGLWQLFRLVWKYNIVKNLNLPVVHLLHNEDLARFNYRNIKVDGILSNIELYVFAGQKGYYVLDFMLLSNGHYMLVNKGITKEKKKTEVRIRKIAVSGVLYCDSCKRKSWIVKNDVDLNTWFTLSAEQISDELGIKLERCILWQENFDNTLLSIQPMKHLEYAITWFILSLVWCVIYCKHKQDNATQYNINWLVKFSDK
ncbi:MAG: SURF1 family protein [Wolbachia endosymbiont of Meromenopon meropis]|nr:SURF1 family protein [Wolbachia endosymbiont of Meromenopon meropis]